MLSPQAYSYLTSQGMLMPENFNKSEYLKRIKLDVEKMLNTFMIILTSQKLDPAYLNKLFPSQKIGEFLNLLAGYSIDVLPMYQDNKLEIARQMVKIGFSHYQDRFKKTKFFSAKINEINELISDLNELANYQIEEEEKLQLYLLRRNEKVPRDIRQMGGDDDWRARCDICWHWSTGKTKADAMKTINHGRGCTYDKKDLENCIRTLQPRNIIN